MALFKSEKSIKKETFLKTASYSYENFQRLFKPILYLLSF